MRIRAGNLVILECCNMLATKLGVRLSATHRMHAVMGLQRARARTSPNEQQADWSGHSVSIPYWLHCSPRTYGKAFSGNQGKILGLGTVQAIGKSLSKPVLWLLGPQARFAVGLVPRLSTFSNIAFRRRNSVFSQVFQIHGHGCLQWWNGTRCKMKWVSAYPGTHRFVAR